MRRRSLVAVCALLAACSSAPNATRPTSNPSPTDPASTTPTGPGREVPDLLRFSADRVGGGTVEGASFAGDKLAVWLWAPW